MKKNLIWIALCALVLTGCNGDNKFLVTTSGTIYECVVVCNDNVRDAVKDTMGAYIYGLPQSEHTFSVTAVKPDNFDDQMKAARNILQVDIDPGKYTKAKAATAVDVWAEPQAYTRINAPSKEAFLEYWRKNGAAIREWFVRQELIRQVNIYKGSRCEPAMKALQRNRYKMFIPSHYLMIKDSTLVINKRKVGVIWCCDNSGSMRKDILIYTYPYTAQSQFTNDSIVAMRDRVVKKLVSAQVEGSYMVTETNIEAPVSRSVTALTDTVGGFYAIETRGLWKIQDGEAMGGPFVSLTRLDQVNGLVVHAEAFMFAPNQKKRSALRKMEAMLYTLRMPNER